MFVYCHFSLKIFFKNLRKCNHLVSKDSVTNMRLFKAHTKQYNKTKRKKMPKFA